MSPSRFARTAGVFLITSVVLATSAGAASRLAPPAQTQTSKSYVFKLSLAMHEQMWTPAQVKAKHPSTGEVMLMGSMMGGTMPMGGSGRHLEVHITSRATGKVVVGVYPTMTTTDTATTSAMSMPVPVAEMRGVKAGSADIHYGNNVNLMPGHTYRVTVTLHGERVAFNVKLPK